MKIRVIEVLASLKRAGAERMAVSLACRLDRDRFEPAVVSLYDAFPEGFEPVLEEHHVPVWHLGKRRGLDLRIYPGLAGVLRRWRPAIVHTHSYVMRYALPASLAAHAGKIVHTVHNVAAREVEPLGRAIHRVGFRCGVAPVAISDEVARSFRETYGFDPAAVIPNGIDTERFARPEARREWRRANGFSFDDLLIASVARLEPQKNPLSLIESFAQALGHDRRCRLLLCGGGSLLETARAHAARCGVTDRVHFLGVRADVAELLAASDVFALSSLWEGSPVAVMEAMAAGLPVVATAVGGVPELVEHGVTGLLSPAGNVEAFAGALAALACDSRLRGEFGNAGLERAGRFGVAAMVDAYAALFERIAAGGER